MHWVLNNIKELLDFFRYADVIFTLKEKIFFRDAYQNIYGVIVSTVYLIIKQNHELIPY